VVLNNLGGKTETVGTFVFVSYHTNYVFVVSGADNTLQSRNSATKFWLVQRVEKIRACVFGKPV